jgi:hypothetical protein
MVRNETSKLVVNLENHENSSLGLNLFMRFLKILTVFFAILLVSPSALAQSEPVRPKFSIGYSIGLPASLHFFLRDVGVQGLGLRADLGGVTLIIFGYFQAAINLEYHLVPFGAEGFYFGVGFAALQGYFAGGVDAPALTTPWFLGGQAYVGFDQGQYFYEAGAMAFLNGGFWFRLAIGYHIIF